MLIVILMGSKRNYRKHCTQLQIASAADIHQRYFDYMYCHQIYKHSIKRAAFCATLQCGSASCTYTFHKHQIGNRYGAARRFLRKVEIYFNHISRLLYEYYQLLEFNCEKSLNIIRVYFINFVITST